MNSAPSSTHSHPSDPIWIRIIGALTLVVACGWCGGGYWLFREVGTIALERQIGEFMAAGLEQQNRASGRMVGASDMPQPPNPRTARPPVPNPLGVLTFQRPLTPRPGDETVKARGATAAPVDPASAAARAKAEAAVIAEGVRQAWAIFNAILAGVLAAGGFGLLAAGSPSRWFWGLLRGGLRGAGLAALLMLGVMLGMKLQLPAEWAREFPPVNDALWPVLGKALSSAAVGLTTSKHEWLGLLMVVVFAMGVSASARLRRGATARAAMVVMITAIFLGTMSSLVGVGALIQYAGYPPLPPLVYAAISLVQSFWMWVLLWSLLWLPREGVAARPQPPAPPGGSSVSAQQRAIAARLSSSPPPSASARAVNGETAPRVIYGAQPEGDSSVRV